MFDDLDTSQAAGMEAADARTLRLSSHAFTQDELQALLRYQEAFLAHAEQPSVGHDGLGAAHELGLKASGLEMKKVEQGLALLRAFSGKRWTVRKLRARLAELEQQTDPVSTEKARRAREEMARVEDLEPLARRYGQETIDLLNEHEERLVDLHARMQKALSRA
jgi:hypothetical protein